MKETRPPVDPIVRHSQRATVKYATMGSFDYQKIGGRWYLTFCLSNRLPQAIIKPFRLKWRAKQMAFNLNSMLD